MSANELQGKKILLGLSGGIACYKAAELTRLLGKAGAIVQVVMNEASTHFITPITLQALSGQSVYLDQWDDRVVNNMAHIELTRACDAFVIAPASADLLAKLALGAADDLLSLLCLARPRGIPLLLAPAMNAQMWRHPATQRNCLQVVCDGALLCGPDAGEQACGESGLGRMLEPEFVLEEIIALFQTKLLANKSVLVTAGPTLESIDPVRAITNNSSGKMGYAMARAAREAGASVTLISGPTCLPDPYRVRCIRVRSASEMHQAVMEHIAAQDIFIAAAAVSDWCVSNVAPHKIKKIEGCPMPQLEFAENPDILAQVAARPNAPFCLGFAAETEDLLSNGAAKRQKKNIPLLAGNVVQNTFGRDENDIIIFDENGHFHLGVGKKTVLARRLIAEVASRLKKIS